MNELFLWATILVVILACWLWVIFRKPKAKHHEEDEHATMVKPRDKHGRWVREADGIIVPKGPGAPYQRRRK